MTLYATQTVFFKTFIMMATALLDRNQSVNFRLQSNKKYKRLVELVSLVRKLWL